jgi:aspartyl-tRNA(Asn)/glutamyl-tRNA(Gln) amidotransferase subunit C
MDILELKITAELAQLELGEGEAASLGAEVEKMLDYFSKMMEAEGLASRLEAGPNRVRRDVAAPGAGDALLENAPELEGRFIVIPNVL